MGLICLVIYSSFQAEKLSYLKGTSNIEMKINLRNKGKKKCLIFNKCFQRKSFFISPTVQTIILWKKTKRDFLSRLFNRTVTTIKIPSYLRNRIKGIDKHKKVKTLFQSLATFSNEFQVPLILIFPIKRKIFSTFPF